ncbi:MAG TPA: amidohydrolase family protein [Blastocatellia bacterium]
MKRIGLLTLFVLALGLCNSIAILPAAGRALSLDESKSLALIGARVYTSPAEEPLINGVVLIRDGKIIEVGQKGRIKIDPGARIINCEGLTLTSGFWNSHVHFTELKWENAASLPSAQLTKQLQDMLTRYGFTTVFDTGSYWEVTRAIRQRIESGAVEGPRIFSTGEILFPKNGAPPRELLKDSGSIARKMPEVENPQQAVEMVRKKLDGGVDAVKIYAQTFWDPNLKMPLEVIKAITDEAHSRGKLVFVHPSNSHGLEAAIASGVDIIVHTTPQLSQWNEALIVKMKQGRIALIPTLKLWRVEAEKEGAPPAALQRFLDRGVDQLRAYFQAGGQILFGTDVGYITDYDPTEEYEQMKRAGMRFRDILASLTTSPAGRFGESGKTGRIAAGMDADIVLLAGDPANDTKSLSDVRYTIRKGKIIYQAR